jgi:hypothetical protein
MTKVKLVPSPTKTKKWRMIFVRKPDVYDYTDFGYKGMSDYTLHQDDRRKAMFLSRFRKLIERSKEDPSSAMTLSTTILWNKPTLQESFKDYKKKFHLE